MNRFTHLLRVVVPSLFVIIVPLAMDAGMTTRIFAIPKLTLMHTLVGVGLLAWLPQSTGTPTLPRRVWSVVGIWLAWLVITTIFAQSPARSWFGSYDWQMGLLTQFGLMGVAWLMLISIGDARAAQRVQWSLALGSLPVIVYGTMQVFQLDPFKWQAWYVSDLTVRRVFSTLGNQNYLGIYLAMAMTTTLSVLLDSKTPIRRGGMIVLLIAQAWCLWLTDSRSAAISLAVSSGLLVLWRWRFVLWQARAMLIGVVVISMAGTFIASSSVGEQIADIVSPRSTIDIRPLIWDSASRAVAARPWLGWGLSSFDLAMVDHAMPSFIKRLSDPDIGGRVIDRAHNLWWELLIEVGVVGLALWLVMMAMLVDAMLAAAAREDENRNLILAGVSILSGYVAYQVFNPNDLGSSITFWSVVGWTLALTRCVPRDEPTNRAAHFVTQIFLIAAAFGAGYGIWSWIGTLRK
jgi:O-antigen ligase